MAQIDQAQGFRDSYKLKFETRQNSFVYDATTNDLYIETNDNKMHLHKFTPLSKSSINHLNEIQRIKYKSCITNLVIQVTQNCNLSCAYCPYAQSNQIYRQHSSKSINYPSAKKAVDFLYEYSKASKEVAISFYGGEPLLSFRLIKEIVEYSEAVFLDKKVHYALTTNGTLLTNEMILFFDAYSFNLTISLDGDKKRNDKHRRFNNSDKSVFDAVMNNIRKINVFAPELFEKLSFSVVMDQTTEISSVDKYFSNNFPKHHVRFNAIETDGLDRDFKASRKFYKDLLLKEIVAKFSLIKNQNQQLTHLEMQSLANHKTYIQKMQPSLALLQDSNPSGNCEFGIQKLFIDVNGNFFPCEKVSENNERNVIGHINNGFNFKSPCFQHQKKNLKPYCDGCFACRQCTICISHYDRNNLEEQSNLKLKSCTNMRRTLTLNLKWVATFNEYIWRKMSYRILVANDILSAVPTILFDNRWKNYYKYILEQGYDNELLVRHDDYVKILDDLSFKKIKKRPYLRDNFGSLIQKKKAVNNDSIIVPHNNFQVINILSEKSKNTDCELWNCLSKFGRINTDVINLVKSLMSFKNLPYHKITAPVLFIYGLYDSFERTNFASSLIMHLNKLNVAFNFWTEDEKLSRFNYMIPFDDISLCSDISQQIKTINYLVRTIEKFTDPQLIIMDVPKSLIAHNENNARDFGFPSFLYSRAIGKNSFSLLRVPRHIYNNALLNKLTVYADRNFNTTTAGVYLEKVVPIEYHQSETLEHHFFQSNLNGIDMPTSDLRPTIISEQNMNEFLRNLIHEMTTKGKC